MSRRYGGTLRYHSQKTLPIPDLILIDGGIGQLDAARQALIEVGLDHVPIAGLAKAKGDKEERIYLPGIKKPIILLSQSPASILVQRIRDEAHRFAITYHRRLRGQALIVPSRKKGSLSNRVPVRALDSALSEHVRRQAVDQQEAIELQMLVGLSQVPSRIEGFDISNTMGTHSVASMVVWEEGQMKKSDYRRFKVKTVEGANDFASMREVVSRLRKKRS